MLNALKSLSFFVFILSVVSCESSVTNNNSLTANKVSALSPQKEVIFTVKAPKPSGAFSQAIRFGNMLYLAGQVGKNPDTGKLENATIETEVRQAMQNLEAVLKAGNSSFEQVIKTNIYLVDVNDFGVVNRIYSEYMGDQPPARTTVGVAALPLGARLEIAMVAYTFPE